MTEKNFKAFCNKCNTSTNHRSKAEHKIDDVIEYEEGGIKETHYLGSSHYQIIECNGCENISYRSLEHFQSFWDIDEKTGKLVSVDNKQFEKFYPERLNNSIVEKRIAGLPPVIKKAYQ